MPRLPLAVLIAVCAGAAAAQTPTATPAAPAATPLAIGRCLWTSLPKATRDALVSSGPRVDDISRALGGLNPSLLTLARSQCPPVTGKDEADKVSDVWTATALGAWAAWQLGAHYHVDPAALDRAWAHVDAAGRKTLIADFDKTPQATRPDLAAMSRDLKLTAAAAHDLLVFWALSQLHLAEQGA